MVAGSSHVEADPIIATRRHEQPQHSAVEGFLVVVCHHHANFAVVGSGQVTGCTGSGEDVAKNIGRRGAHILVKRHAPAVGGGVAHLLRFAEQDL